MREYYKETQGELPRYQNRLHFEFDEARWAIVDMMRQCRSCGQVLVSMNRDVKLMSCGVCKITHYCNKTCQKRDWKTMHKLVCSAGAIVKNLEVSLVCVRILTIMSICSTSASFEVQETSDTLNSVFAFEKQGAVASGDDAFTAVMSINDDDNPVCNHFRDKKEPDRILVPIWDTCTDTLAFVPVSLGFVMGRGTCRVGLSTVMNETFRQRAQMYSVCAKNTDGDTRFALPVHTFVKVCAIDWEM
jgi:hypothetical protein